MRTGFKKYLLAAAAALLVLALVVPLAGCGDQQKAQQIVRGANPNVKKGNAEVEKLTAVWEKIRALPDNPNGYRQGVKLSKDGGASARAAKEEYQKALDALAEAKKLDVSEEYGVYIAMKEKAFRARAQGLELAAQRFDQMSKLYGAALNRNLSQWKLARARIQALSTKISGLPDSDKLDAEANSYAKKKGFGA
ncbi:MAG: hypothetical protein C4521_07080 [Actinobacteria bacterium]|nr:MAG: hypothetical protein C4521_07080 [Actinomycetota bacterium]